MVFWGDYSGFPQPYRGWEVGVIEQPNSTKTELAAAVKKLIQWLRDTLLVDTVTILLPVANKRNLAVYATIGLEEEIKQRIRIPIGQGIAGRIAALREPMIVNNMSAVEVVSPILRQKGLRSLVGVPLFIQGAIGVLHVGTFGTRRFNERDVQQLQLVAHRIGLVMEDIGLSDFETSCHKQNLCLNVKVRKCTPCFNTLIDFSRLNSLLLRARVLKIVSSRTRKILYSSHKLS